MSSEDAKKKVEEAYGADKPEEEQVQSHNLSPLAENAHEGEGGNIELLMDVSVPVVAQLGGAEMQIRDILDLVPGSIIELDKLAGDPVDLYVRGKLFAQGEVVVVDDSFGIRVTKIVNPEAKTRSVAS